MSLSEQIWGAFGEEFAAIWKPVARLRCGPAGARGGCFLRGACLHYVHATTIVRQQIQGEDIMTTFSTAARTLSNHARCRCRRRWPCRIAQGKKMHVGCAALYQPFRHVRGLSGREYFKTGWSGRLRSSVFQRHNQWPWTMPAVIVD